MYNGTSAGRWRQEGAVWGVRWWGSAMFMRGNLRGLYRRWLLAVNMAPGLLRLQVLWKRCIQPWWGEKLVLISSSVMQSLLKVEAVRGMKACSDSDRWLRTSLQEILQLVRPLRPNIVQLFGTQQMSASASSYWGFWLLVCYRLLSRHIVKTSLFGLSQWPISLEYESPPHFILTHFDGWELIGTEHDWCQWRNGLHMVAQGQAGYTSRPQMAVLHLQH